MLNWKRISIRIEKGFLYSCWRRIQATSIIKGDCSRWIEKKKRADPIRQQEENQQLQEEEKNQQPEFN